MNYRSAPWIVPVWLCLGGLVDAQDQRNPPAAVSGIKGVKEDAVSTVKNVEQGNAAPSSAQPVNKINGVNADGRAAIPPVNPVAPPPVSPVAPPPVSPVAPPPVNPTAPPPPPPPPPIVSAGGTAVPAGGGSVGTAANIRAVKGVAGINTDKLQNLEKALILKQGGTGTPTGTGAEKGGKGKSAAAALLAVPLEKKAGPKEDGRAGFQEFEKLQNNGS